MAVILNPNLAGVYSSRGNLLQDLNKYQEALADYDKAIALKPENAEAYLNRENVLNELSRYEEAIESQNKAIELDPSYAKAYYNCGVNLGELKRYEQALTNYENAIDINPDYAEAYSNRGNILKELMRHDEALSSYDQAILIKSDDAEAYFNRGVVFGELKQIKRAINNYEKSISLNPYYAEAYLNKAVLQLTANLNDGWILYKWRWDIKAEYSERFNTKIPNWDGQTDSKSIKILFWGEQGIGDEIFYFGMLKNFTKISARITVAADNRLHSLFKRSMPEAEFIDRKKIDTECNENSFDYQAPIGDIGLLCSVDPLIDFKLPKPFLHINKFRCSDFENKKHIFKDKVVCGLSWKSSNKKIGLSKSLDLIDLSPLLLIENVEFVSLQYGSTKDEINFVENKIEKKFIRLMI
jgi:tetratricopeptide (TPR) repeat protein